MHKPHTAYCPLVPASGVYGGAEHGARWAKNMEIGRKWPKMRTLMVGANRMNVRIGLRHALELVSSPMCPTYPLGVAQTPLHLGMAEPPSEPTIWKWAKLPTECPGVPSPKGAIGWVQDMMGTTVCT